MSCARRPDRRIPRRSSAARAAIGQAGQAGQAGLDYVAVLAVTAAVLVAGVAVGAAKGGEVAGAVRGQMARALCIVRAGDCDRDQEPCVVRSEGTSRSVGANVAFIRLGREHVALVEERSDGTFAVTLLRTSEFGGELGIGAGVDLPFLAAGADVRAAILGREGRGRTWFATSREEVDGLLLGMEGTLVPQGLLDRFSRDPDETVTQHGWDVTLGVAGEAGPVGSGEVRLSAEDLDGARENHDTGRTVLYLRRANALTASLYGPETADRALDAGGHYVWGIEVDRAGRPLDLVIVHSGALDGRGRLPPELRDLAGTLGVPAGDGRRYELESHLDLTVPENLAAARDFIAAVRSGRPRPGRERVAVGEDLSARLRNGAILHVRTYEIAASERSTGGHVAFGLKVGAEVGRGERTARLLAAMTRGPDGEWRHREDCVARA